jgi:hypothetical protein
MVILLVHKLLIHVKLSITGEKTNFMLFSYE